MARRSKLLSLILLGLSGVLAWHAFQGIWSFQTVPGHLDGERTESVPQPQVKGRYGPLVAPVRNRDVPWITYSYDVGGKHYAHETLASLRPPGDSLQVYYDPDHPERSSLRRPEPPVFSAGLAALALALAAIVAVQGRSR